MMTEIINSLDLDQAIKGYIKVEKNRFFDENKDVDKIDFVCERIKDRIAVTLSVVDKSHAMYFKKRLEEIVKEMFDESPVSIPNACHLNFEDEFKCFFDENTAVPDPGVDDEQDDVNNSLLGLLNSSFTLN